MPIFSSILFNRSLKQFLDCQDLASDKGVALTEKIRHSAKESLDKILETIPNTKKPHCDVLRDICIEQANGKYEEIFFNSLENEVTTIRSTAADILSQSTSINPSKLFKRLHETDISKTEIIDILSFQRASLKPEQIINNALKLTKDHAERMLNLALESEVALNLDALNIDPAAIESPSLKILLLRYLRTVKQGGVARVIGAFLTDNNKTIVIEALKSLNALTVPFDASVVLPFIETMTELEREMALEIVQKHANPELIPKLAPWTTTKSEELREVFIKLVVKYATKENLEKFLLRLDQQEWWGKDQAVKCLQKHANSQLGRAAAGLIESQHEFVRNTAQLLAAPQGDDVDLEQIGETALHENWQVRDKAIASIGRSGKRESLGLLKKVVERWPDSAIAVLGAVAQLGFSKGLEIGFHCLKMPEALVQREALETVAGLATKKHAGNVRDTVLAIVPKLQATVRDTAYDVLVRLTREFGLSELKIDNDALFETRLIKIDERRAEEKSIASTVVHEATQVVNFQNIEELKEGDVWMDRYRIKREIGRGAMGRVMLAEDEMVGEPLILKFMHPELTADGASRERFLREVKYSRRVSHVNVIRIHDMLFKDNLCAISMEFFESRGIDELLTKVKTFDVKKGLKILYQVSQGMAAAHKQDVVHRDLKPSNILINADDLVKVVDFGIASATANSDSTLTKTGSIIGTPSYLSPERAKGLEADYRCDIYALGIIAYRMFAGELPYRGEPMSILFQHLEGKAVPVHERNKAISARVSLLIQKMMAVEAENRIQTMDDVGIAIQDALKKI